LHFRTRLIRWHMPINNCCCGGVNCGACASPPTTIQATFTGVTMCSGCSGINNPFGYDNKVTSGSFTNTAYCLTFDAAHSSATACFYKASISPVVMTWYSSTDGSCSGSVVSTYTIDTIYVGFTVAAGPTYLLTLRVINSNMTLAVSTGPFGNTGFACIFDGSQTVAAGALCSSGTYSNLMSTCNLQVTQRVAAAINGSVSMVMNGC